jgi:hypothetical protein
MAVNTSMPKFSGTNIPRPVPDPNQGKLNLDPRGRGRKPNLAPKPVPKVTPRVPVQMPLGPPRSTIPKVDR